MATPTGQVRTFFREYERAVNTYAIDRLCDAYARSYVEAGPGGPVDVVVDDAHRAAVAAKHRWMEDHRGFRSVKAVSVRTQVLGPACVLAQVRWRMRFVPPPGPPAVTEHDLWYVLRAASASLEIVLSLVHDTAAEVLQPGAPVAERPALAGV
jgi:hypothetical protein